LLAVASIALLACSQESAPEIASAGELRDEHGFAAEKRPTIRLDADAVPAALRDLMA
jgi:hypothetical protein